MERIQLDAAMVQAIAEAIGASGVIVLAFGPPRPDHPQDKTAGLAVWSASWALPAVQGPTGRMEALEEEIVDDIEHGFVETEDLGDAIRAAEGEGKR